MERGDVVSILSEDNKEWIYADFGIQCVGGITSGIYTTDSPDQVAFLLNDSNSRFVFVENDEQLDKFLEVEDQVPAVSKCIVLDRKGLHAFSHERVLFLDDLYTLGRSAHDRDPAAFQDDIEASRPNDIAMLVYTSGTTGRPKGAMITQGNIMFAMSAGLRLLAARAHDDQLCFLPLSHVLERLLSVFGPLASQSVVNFAESPETVFDNLREVSPAYVAAVPRVWEKIYSRITLLAEEATPLGRWIYEQAVACGLKRATFRMEGRKAPVWLEAQFLIWDWLVLSNLRRMVGLDRARRIVTGAAPISPDLITWYWGIGLVMLEGYGQTESSGILAFNLPGRHRAGSVGPALAGLELKIDGNGEILARGPAIFHGYWKDPEKTAETLVDGWLHTGDVGHVDDEGFVWITGRIKDIIITAGGKNITPSEFENQLKFSPYILDAVVIGDRRKYLTALIMIDQENVERFAQDQRLPFTDFASLCATPPVQELIRGEIEAVNARFASVEQVKDFRLIDTLLTAEDDELTPTMKLRRSFVEQKHEALINQMY